MQKVSRTLLGWESGAGNASWSCSRVARRAEQIADLSWGSRGYQGASCVGCPPEGLAKSLTGFSPVRAAKATRALHAALYGCRWVDIAPLLRSYGPSMLS